MAGDLSSCAHPSLGRPHRLTAAPPEIVWAAALMFLFGGLACLTAVASPLIETRRLDLVLLVGVYGCTTACALWLWGRRLPRWSLALLPAAASSGVSVVVSACSTSGSVMTAAFGYALVAPYYGYFLSRRMAHLQSLLIAASFGGALLQSGLPGMEVYWAIVSVSVWAAAVALNHLTLSLRQRAERDELTGLWNRGSFIEAAREQHGLAARTHNPLAVAIIDIDDFKSINDTRGHSAGDRLLVKVSRAWLACVRDGDILARLGGDEFVILMPSTLMQGAEGVLAELRKAIVSVEGIPIRWSHGLCMWKAEETLEQCMRRADRALYEKKHAALQRILAE